MSAQLTDSDRLAELASAVAELRAREEIRELFNQYCFAADTGSSQEYADTFAADGVYDGPTNRISGRDKFFTAIDDPNGTHKRDIEGRGSLHTVGGLTIAVDGSRAWVEGHGIVWIRDGDDGYRVYSMTYNHWDLERTNGVWEITLRRSRPVSPDVAPTVLRSWRERRRHVDGPS